MNFTSTTINIMKLMTFPKVAKCRICYWFIVLCCWVFIQLFYDDDNQVNFSFKKGDSRHILILSINLEFLWWIVRKANRLIIIINQTFIIIASLFTTIKHYCIGVVVNLTIEIFIQIDDSGFVFIRVVEQSNHYCICFAIVMMV